MSRSYKKNPFCGNTTAKSEKQDKRLSNRKYRRINKKILNNTQDKSDILPIQSTSDQWLMDKDGKHRFDPNANPKEMRK